MVLFYFLMKKNHIYDAVDYFSVPIANNVMKQNITGKGNHLTQASLCLTLVIL
jgi:hypothetical protein